MSDPIRLVLADDQELVRLGFRMVLDAQLEPQPQSKELLSGVKSFRLRFMNDGRNWQDGWPPPSPSNPPDESWLRWRPIAVEVTLELDDWGTLTRLIEVPG